MSEHTAEIDVLDLDAIKDKWLLMCGPCDGGLPMGCTHPNEDYRPVMLALVREIERLRTRAQPSEPHPTETMRERAKVATRCLVCEALIQPHDNGLCEDHQHDDDSGSKVVRPDYQTAFLRANEACTVREIAIVGLQERLAAADRKLAVLRALAACPLPAGTPHQCSTSLAAHDVLAVVDAEAGRAECATCSGRGVWMDELCGDCSVDSGAGS